MDFVIVKNIKYYCYDIPLLSPLDINKGKTVNRTGIIIRLKDVEENTGFGEIAPLPGLHAENIKTVIDFLDDIYKNIPGNSISEYDVTSGKNLSQLLNIESLPPSVRFGTGMAILDLLANSKKTPLYKLYNTAYNNKVVVNGLLTGPPDDILHNTKKMLSQGYSTLKIKVGRQSVENDIALVQKVRQLSGEKIMLRLDANRAWSLPDALHFAEQVTNAGIEYIEEPLKNTAELPGFSKKSGLPVALDESLSQFDSADGSLPDWISAVILKPSVIGDINKTVQIIKQAKKQNIIPVLSSAFDSGLTLRMLALLSSVFIPQDTAVGLNTYTWLKDDLLTIPFKVDQGIIDVEGLAKSHINLRSPVLSLLNRKK